MDLVSEYIKSLLCVFNGGGQHLKLWYIQSFYFPPTGPFSIPAAWCGCFSFSAWHFHSSSTGEESVNLLWSCSVVLQVMVVVIGIVQSV
jgi:hypothetical protein